MPLRFPISPKNKKLMTPLSFFVETFIGGAIILFITKIFFGSIPIEIKYSFQDFDNTKK